jgi:hypothetical protein
MDGDMENLSSNQRVSLTIGSIFHSHKCHWFKRAEITNNESSSTIMCFRSNSKAFFRVTRAAFTSPTKGLPEQIFSVLAKQKFPLKDQPMETQI